MTDDFLGRDLDMGFAAGDEGWVVAGPFSRLDLVAVESETMRPRELDVATVRGRANLVQALILRLKTERGELAPLGHPEYGTRHLALVGEPNTETNRNLLKLHVLEALRQEPRLERIVRIDVRPVPGNERRGEVRIELELLARRLADPLILVVPFSFEGPI